MKPIATYLAFPVLCAALLVAGGSAAAELGASESSGFSGGAPTGQNQVIVRADVWRNDWWWRHHGWGWGGWGALYALGLGGFGPDYPAWDYYPQDYYDNAWGAPYYYTYSYYPGTPAVTVRSIAAGQLGNYCRTSVKTCELQRTSYLGSGCSCRVPGGRTRGTVTP
jgi:hypothetical protein